MTYDDVWFEFSKNGIPDQDIEIIGRHFWDAAIKKMEENFSSYDSPMNVMKQLNYKRDMIMDDKSFAKEATTIIKKWVASRQV